MSSYVLFETSCCGLSYFLSLEDLILMSEKDIGFFHGVSQGKKQPTEPFFRIILKG